jgi:hypothetical protein
MVFSAHPLSLFTRMVHVASMAYLLGGSLLLWALFARGNPSQSRTQII